MATFLRPVLWVATDPNSFEVIVMRRLLCFCLSLGLVTCLTACGGPKDVIPTTDLKKTPAKDSIQRPGMPPKEGTPPANKRAPSAE